MLLPEHQSYEELYRFLHPFEDINQDSHLKLSQTVISTDVSIFRISISYLSDSRLAFSQLNLELH
jgi:hypothetical protein